MDPDNTGPAASNSRPPAWALLVYLAGDNEWGHEAMYRDLQEIWQAGSSPELEIFVQYDGPEGGGRYVVPHTSPGMLSPETAFRRVDSGKTDTLLDFLRWGLLRSRAARVAFVLGSPHAVSPDKAERDPDGSTIFSLAYDQGSGNYLEVADLAGVIREALRDSSRRQIDLLAIDTCRVQFLELAYELEDIVGIVVAPQTEVPREGWQYERVLKRWKELAASSPQPSAADVARALVDEIVESYKTASTSVSALDLQRLDDVALAFDTLCIATLQVMGEGLIWKARRLLLESLMAPQDIPVYDCGSFFALWEAVLDAMSDEVYQGWLGTTLQRSVGRRLDRFCEALAGHLEAAEQRASAPRDQTLRERLSLIIKALRGSDRKTGGDQLLSALDAGVKYRIALLRPEGTVLEQEAAQRDAIARDEVVKAAVKKAVCLLSDERRFDLERMEDATESARRLADQSHRAKVALLGDPSREAAGMVLVSKTPSGGDFGWPRWSGVSMYRPSQLDALMNEGYQRFKLHRRVHWSAMLGAANLIETHPRALWRLVSSLLATGSAVTRRDVLRRLTGPDSVIWGLRNQFQVMAPAPTLTMSLERQKRTVPATDGVPERKVESYQLRLESITRGAVITEQDSRVQPDVMDRALNRLNELIQEDAVTARSLKDLSSIGGLLGEDILQSLGRTLEDERTAANGEFPDATPHLQLQIPRELMKYPWELMHHRRNWLGERYAIGRQVFMETGLARRVPSRRQGRVRALVVGDPIFDRSLGWRQLPGARREAEQVADWFERAAGEVGSVIDFNRCRDTRIHCKLTSAEMRSLLREGDYDIVHFAGHGVFDADDPETSAWLLSDGKLWALEIRNTLADHPAPPWLVFANACEAGMDASRPERKYQGNVFGLATAFINQGVAAYIAPLWPVDDLLAQHIALRFYEELLSERTTLGEALRRAKASARRLSYPPCMESLADTDSVWAGLGWTSLVLYGDPTEELFQALAGGSHQKTGRRPTSPEAGATNGDALNPDRQRPTGFAVLHAPDPVVATWVKMPNWQPLTTGQRGAVPSTDGKTVLELIEDAGIRRWRVRKPGADTRGVGAAADGLPGSQIAALLADDRVRAQLPSKRGMLRVIGRWVLSGFEDGTLGLVRQYDHEQVPAERLLLVDGSTSSSLVPAVNSGSRVTTGSVAPDRALLLVHGTFSKSASPVDGFGPEFITWARQQYGSVLAFDHWTLSKSPLDNAELLVDEVRAFNPDLLKKGALDIITHSRGGLVARSFCELLDHGDSVRNLIFLGTPNCGTDLANPKNWATFADLLVNMTGVDCAELFGRLAGLLAQLSLGNFVASVPGLLAQSPEAALEAGSFLNRLQNPKANRQQVRYGVVCAEFEPTALVPNLKAIATAAALTTADAGLDSVFKSANDLVVNTAYAWGIARSVADVGSLPAFVSGNRVLVYKPPRTDFTPPDGTQVETALGVHHCNLFSQPRVRTTLKEWLMA
jgi:hypothetical protein